MTTPTISLQLYSVNDILVQDIDATLARLAGIGLTTVEAFDFVSRADELAAAFIRHGLTAKTGHAFIASESVARPDGTTIAAPTHDEVFTAAKTLGIDTVFDPYVAPERWTSLADIEETARLLNAAAASAAVHGLRVGYHNHAHEIQSAIDGRIALEVFADLLDPAVVLEVDLYWAALGAADVPELLTRLGDRVIAVHVKDGTLDSEPTEDFALPTDQVPAGQGAVPLAAALAAAATIEYAVIEFDAYPGGDIIDGIAASYAWLTEQGLNS
ncbi:sugar phosphate isomerase/epimerase [Microbacteriaceae bacterium VKM Ac-2854]|nr:sugar phosphate isomerase/epimerase [Microbacteriaceae bacterium VKM Ac-2854]